MCIYQDNFVCICICSSISMRWNVCVYVWMILCLNVFVSICMQVWHGKEKSLMGILIVEKNAVLCGHEPIILCVLNRFWPSALLNSSFVLQTLASKRSQPETTAIFWCSEHVFWKQIFLDLSSYHIKSYKEPIVVKPIVVKLMFCPLNIGKQNVTIRDNNDFLLFRACFL